MNGFIAPIRQGLLARQGLRARRGLTLIELLLAIALSALLMAAVTGVVQGISRQSRLAEDLERPVWPAEVVDLVRTDLLAASSLWMNEDTLWIRSDPPAYQSPRLAEVSTGVREIGYRCSQTDGGYQVLRRLDGVDRRTLALGVQKILLERLDREGIPQPIPRSPGPVPTQVRLWIWTSERPSEPLVRDVLLR